MTKDTIERFTRFPGVALGTGILQYLPTNEHSQPSSTPVVRDEGTQQAPRI
jgi:hypothetical protein